MYEGVRRLWHAATFGWLCVETNCSFLAWCWCSCSHLRVAVCWNKLTQLTVQKFKLQPPSGGCVLKPLFSHELNCAPFAATFGWLCVETSIKSNTPCFKSAATFGWLCVETIYNRGNYNLNPAATFGWLCVETRLCSQLNLNTLCSHLRVAVCWNTRDIINRYRDCAATFGWLCVETIHYQWRRAVWICSHLRVAVCWNIDDNHNVELSLSSHLRVAVCWNPID